MRNFVLVLLLSFACLSPVVALTESQKADLIGRWKYLGAGKTTDGVTSEDTGILTFRTNGKLIYRVPEYDLTEKGRFEIDGDQLKLQVDTFSGGTYEVISIDKKQMILKSSIYFHFFRKR